MHAALADPARLAITDTLTDGDASPSELAAMLAMPSNLLAHHLRVLEDAGMVTRHRSEGDKPPQLPAAGPRLAGQPRRAARARSARRVLFVCTANSARSHLAAALWRQASRVPAASAGTRPAASIAPGAIAAAARRRLPLPRLRPRHVSDVRHDGDLLVTVCDLAHEELGSHAALHWSVPDPVPADSPESFDAALDELDRRVRLLAPHLAASYRRPGSASACDPAAPLEQDVAPPAVVAADPLPHPDRPEPGPLVQPHAGGVLREHRGLDRPDPRVL